MNFISYKDIITSGDKWVAVGTDVMQRNFCIDGKRYLMSITKPSAQVPYYEETVTLDGGQLGITNSHISVDDAVGGAYGTVVMNYNNRKGLSIGIQNMVDKANDFGKSWGNT